MKHKFQVLKHKDGQAREATF